LLPRRPHLALLPALLLLGGGLAACGEDKATTIDPEIGLVGPDGAPLEVIDFGMVTVGTSKELVVRIKSRQQVELRVSTISTSGDDAVSFVPDPAGPLSVPGLDERTFRVTFSPAAVRAHEATLVVRSNDPAHKTVTVPLVGTGVTGSARVVACIESTAEFPTRCADTQVSPPLPLVLGDVIEGRQLKALVAVFNDGDSMLSVSSIAFTDPSAAAASGFSFVGDVTGGASVAPHESVSFKVLFAPNGAHLGPVAASVQVASDDPEEPLVTVQLEATARPNTPPQACLALRQVIRRDGTVVELPDGVPPDVIEPLDRLVFDAAVREGCSGDFEDGDDVTLSFTVEGPGLAPPVELVDGEPTRRAIVPEVPGDYRVRLVVRDPLGKTAAADAQGVPAEVAVRVVVQRDVGVYLTWADAPFVDLDVHLVHPDALLWDGDGRGPSDCHYRNRHPNWGSTSSTLDDPLLAIDDQGTGQLVESVELDDPEPGARYQLHAHFSSDARQRAGAPSCTSDAQCGGEVCSAGRCMPGVQATVEVWLKGHRVDLAAEYPTFGNPRTLVEPCDDWFVGFVEWPATAGGAPAFIPFLPPGGPVTTSGTLDGTVCVPPE
jgi:hypothetical protein